MDRRVGRWFLDQKLRSFAKQRTTYPSSGMIMSAVKHTSRNIAGGPLDINNNNSATDMIAKTETLKENV